MIGHEIGGRYQILERIGGGGMALVYKAQDLLLNRHVAIKVLRQQFVNDEEFIRRFRREAQSAASLSHPNVVSIYDVGEEDEVHYIVMEYVEGQNLNEIIKERAPLQVDEAIRIAAQICDALDHAHQNQIIHRDIKPHNILIGRNGRVKVTDFGIARAVTSATITQTGSVMGSVHYFSPEHAKGVAAGEKSDLYSLGIVLYQMLTGKLPFHGESPISVALKHLQEDFEEPRLVNPMIPQSVENIICKSMRKNPGERYNSAQEMLLDLETCLLPERRTEPKLAFGPEDEDNTLIIPAIKPQPAAAAAAKSRRNRDYEDSDVPDEASKEPESKKKSRKPLIWAGIVLAIIVILGGMAWYFKNQFEVPDVTVPNLIGMTQDDARTKLTELGLAVGSVKQAYNKDYDPDVVYEQSKPEGTDVKEGALIDLTVSIEKPLQQMIDLSGMTLEEAKQQLVNMGVNGDSISSTEDFSDTVEAGKVISQDPAPNSEFDPEVASVHLTVSKGKESVAMPDLTGLDEKTAKSKLDDLGLSMVTKQESSFTVDKGLVIEQWPYKPGDSAEPGEEVTLTISTGYPEEAVNYSYGVPVAPAQADKNSKIRIVFSDARGDNQDWGTKTINTVQTLSVDLVLAPNKDASVSVYRDGQLFDTYRVSYIDAKQGTVPTPELPVTAPPETSDPGESFIPGESDEDGSGNDDTGSNNSGNSLSSFDTKHGHDKGKDGDGR
ncbi:Stk1 family PASTA domain-containing Ser/Thr kinase [Paenibacillus physcomitrellae]|uniref:non-specific serine/threonine protein kinase n=1 Tax=Paenibacillus physcomitrellae TaxID=1619311 RepID=A0ABQ1FM83_9BACL|nr:Stk1 family PASTA domain-containing Ser/Thr kinase [Paenibacillus physcomitrellae]GGA21882.1 serine/threonine-protein kinase PrkC [Paenibacillus physcomitrellae]